ncbi:2'-5' RNA ligase family protein [Pseudonocardia ailaonensis]|uniref:2'-5' RNA ligase family protein n=1 Tax=Pseudonocardia ailaonensis TaxID=367279 RepID=A0ABN2NM30_9PSEU
MPLIVTATLDAPTQERFDALRRRHFPSDRNFLAAHLTLFHALPDEPCAAARTAAATPTPTTAETPGPGPAPTTAPATAATPGPPARPLRQALAAAARRPPIPVRVTGLRLLGRGVAYRLEAPELLALRADLARDRDLTAQDRGKRELHVTVQNKVTPERARALHAELSAAFVPETVTATGLALWRYLGGPWEPLAEYRFSGP